MKIANIANIPRGRVMGFPVAASTIRRTAILLMSEAASLVTPCLAACAGMPLITRAVHDVDFGDSLRVFDLICPEGVPLVWMLHDGRTSAERSARRIDGISLMSEVWRLSENSSEISHFILGRDSVQVSRLEASMKALYPGTRIAGAWAASLNNISDKDSLAIADMIGASGANMVWLGGESPVQEDWLARHSHILTSAVYVAVGGAFGVLSGEEKRAPQWMMKLGVDWIATVMKDPSRVFRRDLRWNLLFFYYAMMGKGR